MPELQVVTVPSEIATGPEYGLAVLKGADPRAPDLALFMFSPEGSRFLPNTALRRWGCPRLER